MVGQKPFEVLCYINMDGKLDLLEALLQTASDQRQQCRRHTGNKADLDDPGGLTAADDTAREFLVISKNVSSAIDEGQALLRGGDPSWVAQEELYAQFLFKGQDTDRNCGLRNVHAFSHGSEALELRVYNGRLKNFQKHCTIYF